MLIARQKRSENIAEYLLYMWQIEDTLRAFGLDINRIDEQLIARYNLDEATRKEMREWYDGLIEMMRHEHVTERGHLQINKNTLSALADVHNQLLRSPRYADYTALFYKTLPFIVELRAKAGDDKAGEIETCFNALYGVLMLRLQKREITPDTELAVAQISKFIATLAAYYHKNEKEPLFDDDSPVN